ncbi:hypothetical protein EV182_005130 [Spiromyces aspiralis]|uniref:Uncharacterized protein n=1 Tax=Spiromyces aspiralis TaxID=68401 RepID=A0ACC1HCP3_9FUNG|nr:hypothetical protein EV182_005130 [Spiromyces aspiralis]
MKPYLSCNSPDAGPFDYNLYAVLVHAGGSARSGHYYAFVKSPGGVWYEMNDSMVTQASERRVLQASAYLLFYQRSSILPDQSGSAGAQKRAAESLAESAAALLAAQAKMCGEHSASAAELGADSGSTAIATVAKDNNRNQEEPEHLGRHRDSSKQNCQKSPKRPRKGNRDEIDQLFDRQRKTSTTARPESPDQSPSSPAKVNLIESLAKRRPTSGEWVVKDKPTQDPATVSSAATVVRWDESNKSKLEKASLLSVRTSTAPTTDIDPDSKGRLKDSQFSVRVATWDDQESPDASSSAAAERKGVIRSLGNATKHLKRRPDTWDVEYDRGKVKKARKDKGVVLQQSNTNPFQVVSERKSGPGKKGGAKKRKAKKHKHKKQKRQ